VYAKTRKDAGEALTRMLTERDTGTAPTTAGKQTVEAYLTRWLARIKPKVRPTTHRHYTWMVNDHIVPELGGIRLQRLSSDDVDRAMANRLAAGLSPRSVHHMRAVLRTALTRALRDRLVAHNVAKETDPPKVERAHVKSLTPEEARTFLEGIGADRLEALYRVALAVGLRSGEALGLRWEDIDLDARRLHVTYALQRVDGRLVMVEPKTERSRRTVPLPEVVVDALRRHRRRQLQDRLLAGARWRETGLVFTTTIGTPLDHSSVSKAFHAALTAAGVRRIRFHDLRHSCASLLLAQGVPARVVMEVLGHSTITLTMNTYSHVIPALLDDAAAAMDRALGGA
jgi:integrase